MIDKILDKHKVTIVANGNLPERDIILKFSKNKPMIATDGSYDKLQKLNIKPNFVIGDKDSIVSATEYIHIAEQESTDLEKSILFAQNRGLSKIMIFGVFGGELDHAINNLMSISKYMNHNIEFTVIDQYLDNKIKIGIFLKNNCIQFSCIKNTVISILPLPFAIVSSSGLQWELDKQKLNFDCFTSARNRNILEDVSINCIDGKVLVIIDYVM